MYPAKVFSISQTSRTNLSPNSWIQQLYNLRANIVPSKMTSSQTVFIIPSSAVSFADWKLYRFYCIAVYYYFLSSYYANKALNATCFPEKKKHISPSHLPPWWYDIQSWSWPLLFGYTSLNEYKRYTHIYKMRWLTGGSVKIGLSTFRISYKVPFVSCTFNLPQELGCNANAIW